MQTIGMVKIATLSKFNLLYDATVLEVRCIDMYLFAGMYGSEVKFQTIPLFVNCNDIEVTCVFV